MHAHYHRLLASVPEGYGEESFLRVGYDALEDITPEEVEAAVCRLRNHKALGESWISAELLKLLDPSFYTALAALFNRVR